MTCFLCLGAEVNEQLIDISSEYGQQLNVASIVHMHFGICFHEQPREGSVCQKCWVKVSVFHEFFTCIEYLHRSKESIFAECIVDNTKYRGRDDRSSPEDGEANCKKRLEKPKVEHKKRRRLGSESITSQDSDTYDRRQSNDNAGINYDEESMQKAELQTTNSIKIKRKKGRQRNGEQPKCDDAKTAVLKVDIPQELNINNEPIRKRGRPRKDDPVKPRSKRCNRCSLEFPSFRGLSRHIKVVHIRLPFGCKQPRCVESFATQEDHDAHFAAIHKQTECPHCHKIVLESSIGQHIRNQHQSIDNHIVCDLCGKVSSTMPKHKAHYRKIHEVHGKVQCDICKDWTKHKESLRRHMLRKHIDGIATCAICGHISPNRNALRDHSRMHMPDFKTRWKCVHCGRGFRDKLSLMEHSHIHTGFAGQYTCKDCGKTFRFNSSYYVHKKKMHPKDK